MIHSKFPGSGVKLGDIGVVVSLAAQVFISHATPMGNRDPQELTRYPSLLEGRGQLGPVSERPTDFSAHIGATSNSWYRSPPTAILNDIRFEATGTTRPGGLGGMFQNEILSDNPRAPTLVGHPLDHLHDGVGNQDNPHVSNIGYDDFPSNWIYEPASSTTHINLWDDPRLIYEEKGNVWDHAGWEPQIPLSPAEAPPSFLNAQASDRPRLKSAPAAFKNTQEGHPEPGGEDRQYQSQYKELTPDADAAAHAIKRPRISKDDILNHGDYIDAHHYDSGSSLTGRSSRGAAGNVEVASEPSANELGSANQPEGSERNFPESEEKHKALYVKLASPIISRYKEQALENSNDRLDLDLSALHQFAETLQYMKRKSHQTVALRPDGNFNSDNELAYLLKPNLIADEQPHQCHQRLLEYFFSYQACYKLPLKSQTDMEMKKYSRKKMYSNLNYFLGTKRLSRTALGRRIKELESKWLDQLVTTIPKDRVTKLATLKSWYHCIKLSTTSVLYQVELIYRLSNAMEPELPHGMMDFASRALEDIDNLWMNFPFHVDRPFTLPKSNQFFSNTLVPSIKKAKSKPGETPPEYGISQAIFRAWLLKQNPEIFLKLGKNSMPEAHFIDLLRDCAWAEYQSMKGKGHDFFSLADTNNHSFLSSHQPM